MASLSPDAMFLLSLALTGLLLCREDRRDFSWGIAGAAFAAVASFIKMTFLMESGLIFTCFGLHCFLHSRPRRIANGLAIYLVLSLGAWCVLGGQSLGSLPAYIRTSLEITSAYTEAMGAWGEPNVLLAGFVVLCLTAGALIVGYLQHKAWRNIAPTLLLLGTLFLAWKQGFNRADTMHIPAFFAAAIPVLVLAGCWLGSPDSAPKRPGHAILILALAVMAWGPLTNGRSLVVSIPGKLAWLARARLGTKSMERDAKEAAQEFALPKIKAMVGDRTVDVAGWEQSYAILNGLNYRPAPIFQAYQAATPALIKLNTEFYQSQHAPDFVLFEVKSIDNRFPTLDSSLVLPEILQRYEPVLTDWPYLLLQHRAGSTQPSVTTLFASGEIKAGKKLPLPPGPVWCELDFRETFAGKLLRTLLHGPVITMETVSTGPVRDSTWKLIPANARAGFLLSPLIRSNKDFLAVLEGNGVGVESIKIRPDPMLDWLFRPKIGYRLYQFSLAPPADSAEARAKAKAIRTDLETEEATTFHPRLKEPIPF
jgi:hypothetical protein